MLSLNQIVSHLQEIQEEHPQINDFYFGDPFEITETSYPMLGVSLLPGTISRGVSSLRFLLFIADLVDEDESFETEVLSDTNLIALDVYAKFWRYLEENNIELSRDASFSSFTEKFDDRVSGWQMEIEVRQFYSKNECEVPTTIVEEPVVDQSYITTSLPVGQILLEDLVETSLFNISWAGLNIGQLSILAQMPGLEIWNPETSQWEIFAGFSIDVPEETYITDTIYKARLNQSEGAVVGDVNKLYIIASTPTGNITYEKDFILT